MKLQEDLLTVKQWKHTWCLLLNDCKCTDLHIGNSIQKEAYINNLPVTEVQFQKYVLYNPKWKQYITLFHKKASDIFDKEDVQGSLCQ